MKPLSVALLAGIATVLAAATGLLSAISLGYGRSPLQVTPWVFALFLGLVVMLLWAGVAVKKLRSHQDTWMTPILAVRVAIAAHVSGLVGAGFAGVFLGVALVSVTRLDATSTFSSAITCGIGALTALVLCVTGVIVERWCIVDSNDSDDSKKSKGGIAGKPA